MQKSALKWIANLLDDRQIPFLVCGGLAAISYGSTRPLNDIDLLVPGDYFREVVEAGKEHISKPAQHYCEKSAGWDLEYVQFKYHGVKIEVASSFEVKVYDSREDNWYPLNIDFSDQEIREVLGVELPVMSRHALVSYKARLSRKVDLQDIEAIEKNT